MALRLDSTETDNSGEGTHLQQWHRIPDGSAPTTGVTAWTVTGWVYEDLSAGAVVFSTLDTASPFDGVSVVIFGTSGQLGIWDPDSFSYLSSTTETVTANTWTFVAVRCSVAASGGTVDVSVNGNAWDNIKSGDTSGIESDAGQQNTGHTNDANWTTGSMADLRYYERELSESEIQTIANARGRDDIVDYRFRYPMREKPPSNEPATFIADQAFTSVASGASGAYSVPQVAQSENGLGMIAIIATTNNTGTPPVYTAPSGWTLRNSGNTDAPSTFSTPRVQIYTRDSGSSSEPSTYTWNFNGSCTQLALILAVRGTTEATNALTASTGTSSSPSSPTASPSGNALCLRVVCVDSQDPVPAAYYQFFPSSVPSNNLVARRFSSGLGNGVTLGVCAEMVASGATGARTWNPTISEQWIGLTLCWLMGSGATRGPRDVSINQFHAISYGNSQFLEDDLY